MISAIGSSPHSLTAWETEDEMSLPASSALTTPLDAKPASRNSRTSSWGSKRSRRSVTPPGRITRSPPMPGSDKTDKSDRVSRDLATDENISILDPRRFTPTLHANLVGEILSLKRDKEENLKVIESLETTLQSTRDEGVKLETAHRTTAKENRSLKRQLALLEGGTSSALAELARERDEAVDSVAETKRRLELAQKKLKTQEDDSAKRYELWTQEKNGWEEERRKTDRKVHVLETRLKAVLEEMAAFQAAAAMDDETVAEGDLEDGTRDSDAGSIRTMSLRGSLRYSLVQKANGQSLADELDFDDDSDYQTDANGRESVMSTHKHSRSGSRASTMSRTHRRHHSSESLIRPGSVTRVRFQTQAGEVRPKSSILEDDEMQETVAAQVSYTDTGVQFSPPASPEPAQYKTFAPIVHASPPRLERQHEEGSTEANQRRKRISIAKPLVIPPPAAQGLTASAGAQTSDAPLSPPKTPRSPSRDSSPKTKARQEAVMITAGTQTDPQVPPRTPTPPPASLAIPSISIHPPTSRPTTPRESKLPQLSRNFACQVALSGAPMNSTGIQTEEIRVDQRLDMLPPHLHPSAITSRPASAAGSQTTIRQDGHFTPVPGNIPARNPRRLTSLRSVDSNDNSTRDSMDLEAKSTCDSRPLSQKSSLRKSHRISSMFHHDSSGDELDDFAGGESDTEFRTALTAPKAVKSPSSAGSAPASPEETKRLPDPDSPIQSRSAISSYKLSGNQGVAMPQRQSSTRTPLQPSAMASSKAGGMRRSAMIQNGINSHQEDTSDPPFPIPTRASSRQPLFSAGGRSVENRSPTRREPWHRKGSRTSLYRGNSVRKSRSAVAAPLDKYNRRRGNRSPPYSPALPETPTMPPLPSNARDLTTPKNERQTRGHRHQYSDTTATTAATGRQSAASSQGPNTVVDAITQTMVGEWMFKYVRRRKSFGISSDNSGRDDSSNDRHRRWVWLAPYERAILWSSKQPSSGSALLGKSGRKLTIQSVLDVKDDNPAPKGQLAVFNRSILILTPQRALKFTAINADRHYLWLTALSFLAHSQQDVPEIPFPVPPKAPETELSPKEAKTRRPRIRDSIRLAKSQNLGLREQPSRLSTGLGSTMSSQGGPRISSGEGTISPMPSIPDVPPSLVSSYRSAPLTAQTQASTRVSTGSNHTYPSSHNSTNPASSLAHQRDGSEEAAIPPAIPRFGREQPALSAQSTVHGRKRSNTGGRIPPPLSFRGFGGSPTYTGHSSMNNSGQLSSTDLMYGNGPKTAGINGDGEWAMAHNDDAFARNSEASSVRGSVTGNLFEAIGTVRMEAFCRPLASCRYESVGLLNYDDPIDDIVCIRLPRWRTMDKLRQRSRSRSRSRNRESFSRGGVAAWKEEYWGYAANGGGQRGRTTMISEDGDRMRGRERGENPFEGF